MWLFRFPLVTSEGPRTERIAPTISFVVVLPLLPVMATTGPANARRRARAHAVNATSVSGTTICGRSIGSWRSTSSPEAPRPAAAAAKSCPSALLAFQRDEQRTGGERP